MFILPVLTTLLLGLNARSIFNIRSYRKVFVLSLIGFGLLALFITETLSLFQLFESVSVIGLYTIINLFLVGVYIKINQKNFVNLPKKLSAKWFYSSLKRLLFWIKMVEKGSVIYLAFISITLTVTFLIASIAAPNNYDSMTYHLARVMHWIANASVDYYPTHIDRQLYSGPLAEYLIAQFQIIHQSDRFANLVSWIYGIGCLAAGSLIVKELGGRFKTQLIATVIIATAPEVILQSTSTQNDLVVSFFIMAFVYFVLVNIKNKNFTLATGLLLGITLGLALLTKGTAYVYTFPFLVWYCVELYYNNRKCPLRQLTVIISCALVINSVFYLRNIQYYHYPLGDSSQIAGIKNQCPGLKSTASNLVRNIASQIWTPSQVVNKKIYQGVSFFHSVIKQDINANCTTFLAPANNFTPIAQLNQHEDIAGNPFQIVFFLAGLVLFISHFRSYPKLSQRYLLAVATGFILFSIAFKWQTGINRLNLPLIALGSVSVIIFDCKRLQKYSSVLISCMLIMAVLPVFFNEIRPVFSSHFLAGTRRISSIFTSPRYLQYFSSIQGL